MKNGKHVILCIDDDPNFLESITSVLEEAGYLLETASSAEEALKRYDSVRPDMVLLDIMMEEIDTGLNLVKEIKALGDPSPICLLSGLGQELQRNVDQSSLGVVGTLQKPVPPDTLLNVIKSHLKT